MNITDSSRCCAESDVINSITKVYISTIAWILSFNQRFLFLHFYTSYANLKNMFDGFCIEFWPYVRAVAISFDILLLPRDAVQVQQSVCYGN